MSPDPKKAHSQQHVAQHAEGREGERGTSEELSIAQLFSTSGEEPAARASLPASWATSPYQSPSRADGGQVDAWRVDPAGQWTRSLHWLAHGSLKLVVLSLVAWGLLFNFSEVRGSSMQPGIHDRDRILVDHLSYLVGDIQRGDIVVLRYPLDPSLDYIKRIVGLPGEEVRIDGGRLWIDGHLIDEPYVAPESIDPFTRLVTRVQEGHYFVLGDNRLRSSDSREFGQVPHSHIRGKVSVRLWPPDRVGWIE